MNQLSWLLYLAEVAQNLSVFFFVGGAASLIGAAICLMMASFEADMAKSRYRYYSADDAEAIIHLKNRKRLQKSVVPIIITGLVLFLVSGLIPRKQTIYLIAASELGEQVLRDERVVDVTNKSFMAIEAFLDQQIAKSSPLKVETNDVP